MNPLLRSAAIWCACGAASVLAGCGRGFIYTDMTYPIVRNMNSTKVGSKMGSLATEEVRIPVSRGNLSAAWKSRAIADAAKAGDIDVIYYADERMLSILGGIWRRRIVMVYGD